MSTITRQAVKKRSILTRGLNIQGQLGIRSKLQNCEEFRPVDLLQDMNITHLVCDHSQNYAVINNKSLIFWGWPLCTKTTYKVLEIYHKLPSFMRLWQNYAPFFKAAIQEPVIEAEFSVDSIKSIDVGCGYVAVVDNKNKLYMWGDNYAGQLGQNDNVHRDTPLIVQSLLDDAIIDVSCGFQHALALSADGTVFGIGKNDRYQCGEEKKLNDESGEITNSFGDPFPIRGFNPTMDKKEASHAGNEPIIQAKAGKFHSLFLSDRGRVYGLGSNIYGQLCQSNNILNKATHPTEIFLDGMKIKQIEVGNHHSMLLNDEGRLFVFGSNLVGQVTSKHSTGIVNYLHEISLPSDSKIERIKASNLRSCAFLENGEVWFWGGFFYREKKRLVIDDFNLLNEEEGIPSDVKIADYHMGFGHDVVMTEELDHPPINIDSEYHNLEGENAVV
ncbi:unnamed protein product [Moneuplotes crassus]|uniref:RCC1-like domain-containing protein n=1 Tax=Euplotes crassus TaxID=5936 RepID=A0AAD1UJD0_EUPCR|nr:unnamed protein product [Moneuplotes crassus]